MKISCSRRQTGNNEDEPLLVRIDKNSASGIDTERGDTIKLLDVLFNRGCISSSRKNAIERKPLEIQKVELFLILANGSNKIFEQFVEFFRETNQSRVLAILVGNYVSEDVHDGVRIVLIRNDITTFKVDAIVNAANPKLSHNSGVAADIVKAGGNEISEECQQHLATVGHELRVGDIFVSTAGKLPCKSVIHTIGPMWWYGDMEEERQLVDSVRKSLVEASQRSFQSIAFPAISSGYRGYPVDMSASTILDTIYSYLGEEKSTSLRTIYIVDKDEFAMQCFERKLGLIRASRNAEFHVGHHDVQHVKTITVETEFYIFGVTWLENKIYVMGNSTKLYVFQDQEPYEEINEECMTIPGINEPDDLVASKSNRSLFISDATLNHLLWKVQIPGGEVRQWVMEGLLVRLSINSSDELIVVVSRGGTLHLDIYQSSDVVRTRSISLPIDITLPSNAVQSSKGSFFILYGNRTSPRTICELSFDEEKIIRSLDFPSSLDDRFKAFCPRHLSIDEDDRVFVTHYRAGKVLLYNSQLTHFKELLSERHQIRLPQRIYYLHEKQQLIVGHGRAPSSVSIFELHP